MSIGTRQFGIDSKIGWKFAKIQLMTTQPSLPIIHTWI